MKKINAILWTITGVVVLTWTACNPPHFSQLYQPDSAAPNASFEVEVAVTYDGSDDGAEQIITKIGLALPAGIKDHIAGTAETSYKLVFGIQLPVGWTVADMIPFTGVDEGVFAYSDSLSNEVITNMYPPDSLYYWWVAETVDFMETDVGTIYFNPVITTSQGKGMYFLDYMLGHYDGSSGYYSIYDDASWDNMITIGLPDTVYVTNTAGSGPGSLQEAIDSVSAGGHILFDLPMPAVIYLQQTLNIYKGLSITGPPCGNLVITATTPGFSLISIADNRLVNLSNLQVVNGNRPGGYGGGIYCGNNSRGTMTNLRVENNTASRGGGIYLYGGSGTWTMKGVTVRNNVANSQGGGIFGTGNVVFDPTDRCSIYSNQAPLGSDLYGGHGGMITLKKFTVMQPNDYFAYPQESYNGFNIQQAALTQLDQDVYVSPAGSDSNSGTSPSSPFKTITQALKMTISNPQAPNTIHLAAGTYSTGTNGETFPLQANSHVHLCGAGRDLTSMTGSYPLMRLNMDNNAVINGLGIGGRLEMTNAGVTITDFLIQASAYNSIINVQGGSLMLSDGLISGTSEYYYLIILSSSSLMLNQVEITGHSGGLLNLQNTNAELTHCQIHNSNADYLVSVGSGSHLSMSGTTLRNNQVNQAAIGFYGNSTAWFDPQDRCNIYGNISGTARELITESYTGTGIQVVLDTFDVLHPNPYYVSPVSDFSFDILHGLYPQASQNLYVSKQGSDENSGLTPDDPFLTLTKACRTYYPGENSRDTIFIGEGTYQLNYYPELPSLYLPEGLTLSGAGRGLTYIQGSSASVIADGLAGVSLSRLKLSGNPALRVTGSNIHLHHCDLGFTTGTGIMAIGTCHITGDSALITGCQQFGIDLNYSISTLENLNVSSNRTGIYINGGVADMHDMVIASNNQGGYYEENCGIYANSNSSLNLNQSLVSANTIGVRLYNTEASLNNVEFTGNTRCGLYAEGYSNPTVALNNSLVQENGNGWETGGGISSRGSLLQISNTRISGNFGEFGGGIALWDGSLSLENCRITHNKASQSGGGLAIGSANSLFFSGSTISNNQASYGGGICFGDFLPELNWDTINRCNIYFNRGFTAGHDLCTHSDTIIFPVVLDTFTLFNPTDRFAFHTYNFDFDILKGFSQLGAYDYYVSPEGNDLNSGHSWEEPLQTIHAAVYRSILDTVPPHRVFLADGVYSASLTGETFPVELTEEMEIKGAGPGQCVIDGEFQTQLFLKKDPGRDYLGGMNLTGGNAAGGVGGGIYSTGGGMLELENIRLDTNMANQGGAIYIYKTELQMRDALLTRNIASSYGGAIYSRTSHQSLNNVIFSGNKSLNYGGAMHCVEGVTSTWENVRFTGNAARRGGAMSFNNSFINHSENILFEDNYASAPGGAVYIQNATGRMANMTIHGNKALSGGGLAIYSSPSLSLQNLLISGNEATDKGSAMYLSSSGVQMSNLTITGNTNTAADGSMIWFSGKGNRMDNNIIFNNSPGYTILNNNAELAVNHCNIEGGPDAFILKQNAILDWGDGNIDLDPEFLMTGEHPYELSAFSPCIDAGNPDTSGMSLAMWDLMGNYRLWDGNGDGDTLVDMGAYEFGSVGVGLPGQAVQSSKFKVQSFPNPFAVNTTIVFKLEEASMVRIEVYHYQGIKLETLASGRFAAGSHKLVWNASGLPSGLYLLKASDGKSWNVKKLIKL